jgi:hypothetical protein
MFFKILLTPGEEARGAFAPADSCFGEHLRTLPVYQGRKEEELWALGQKESSVQSWRQKEFMFYCFGRGMEMPNCLDFSGKISSSLCQRT